MRGVSAKEPQDKVFAFLRMIRTESAQFIGSSYSLPYIDTYPRATFASIQESGDFGILSHVNFKKKNSRADGLPSWAVDFRCQEKDGSYFSRIREPLLQTEGWVSRHWTRRT